MSREESSEVNHAESDLDVGLDTAFKRLKVDLQWSEDSIADDFSTRTLRDLWSGKSLKSRVRSKCADKSSKKVQRCSKRGPYIIDSLPSMDKLTISEEACSCSSCNHCQNTDKAAFGIELSQKTSPLLRQARLKIHHREKDKRSVISKAKLKLKVNCERRVVGAGTMPSGVFGVRNESKLNTFLSLIENSSDSCAIKKKASAPFETSLLFHNHWDEVSDSLPEVNSRLSMNAPRRSSTSRDTHIPSRDTQKIVTNKSRDTQKLTRTCSQEAKLEEMAVDELAGYFEDMMYIPKKMSDMAEMMYT